MTHPVQEVTVRIGGAAYQVRSDMSEAEVARIASYVDQKMKDLDPKGVLAPVRASVLASLTIAGELLQERGDQARGRTDLARRLQDLNDKLDAVLATD